MLLGKLSLLNVQTLNGARTAGNFVRVHVSATRGRCFSSAWTCGDSTCSLLYSSVSFSVYCLYSFKSRIMRTEGELVPGHQTDVCVCGDWTPVSVMDVL